MAKRPVSAVGNKRPISQYAKQAAKAGGDPRYKVNNYLGEISFPQVNENKNVLSWRRGFGS